MASALSQDAAPAFDRRAPPGLGNNGRDRSGFANRISGLQEVQKRLDAGRAYAFLRGPAKYTRLASKFDLARVTKNAPA
jgi:hypothetical protein